MYRWLTVVSALAGLRSFVQTIVDLTAGDGIGVVVNAIVTGFFWWPVVGWWRSRGEPAADTPVTGPPEPLRPRGRRRWLLPVFLLVVVGVLGLFRHPFVSLVPVYALVFAGIMVWLMRTGGDQVDFDDDALVVRHRTGTSKRFAWGEVLELSWASISYPSLGSGPVARIRGGAFDTPGPTAPGQLAIVLLAGRASRAWGREQVRKAAALHGIPFSDDLMAAINSGRRPARLPGESS